MGFGTQKVIFALMPQQAVIPPNDVVATLLLSLLGIVVLGIIGWNVGNWLRYKLVRRFPSIEPNPDGILESETYREWREMEREYYKRPNRIH